MLVSQGQQRWVVRIDGQNPAQHGLSRQAEWHVLQEAAANQLAPAPCYFNPELGALVCSYLPPDTQQNGSPQELARLLRRIHGLSPCHHRVHLPERILRYEKRFPADSPARAILQHGPAILALLNDLQGQEDTQVLCHNDLLAANRLRSGGCVYALDWEYCAMGSRWYELAVVIVGDGLQADDAAELAHSYLGRAPSVVEQSLLSGYCSAYRYIELLWHLTLGHSALSAQQIEEKTQALRRDPALSP